ncbi:putative RNA recognition motif-containing protein 4 [Homarus americanus]|uniref:Putative RNA recognition motif-containing protein 4 n=1 Tax=Homarus americanus TaxID=6706 RepID=A0A8J5K875_HOMAM|nr:putative RNA recognition motif-containing protein 4 [Homarus americanus]
MGDLCTRLENFHLDSGEGRSSEVKPNVFTLNLVILKTEPEDTNKKTAVKWDNDVTKAKFLQRCKHQVKVETAEVDLIDTTSKSDLIVRSERKECKNRSTPYDRNNKRQPCPPQPRPYSKGNQDFHRYDQFGLFIKNIPPGVTYHELRSLFGRHGGLMHFYMPRKHGGTAVARYCNEHYRKLGLTLDGYPVGGEDHYKNSRRFLHVNHLRYSGASFKDPQVSRTTSHKRCLEEDRSSQYQSSRYDRYPEDEYSSKRYRREQYEDEDDSPRPCRNCSSYRRQRPAPAYKWVRPH